MTTRLFLLINPFPVPPSRRSTAHVHASCSPSATRPASWTTSATAQRDSHSWPTPSSAQNSRHVDRKLFKMRELRGAGEVTVDHVPTELNPADLMTKILKRQVFEKHRRTVLNCGASTCESAEEPAPNGASALAHSLVRSVSFDLPGGRVPTRGGPRASGRGRGRGAIA